jgi:hypothetical protein
MVLNAGVLNVMELLSGDVAGKKFSKLVVGTSGAAVTGAETALENQVALDIETFNILAGGYIQFNSTLGAGDPAMVIKEAGVLNDAGVLCYRQVVTPQNKVAGVVYAIRYKIRIQ